MLLVIPANTGIQSNPSIAKTAPKVVLDSRVRGNDKAGARVALIRNIQKKARPGDGPEARFSI
jgi:hypothetical protein